MFLTSTQNPDSSDLFPRDFAQDEPVDVKIVSEENPPSEKDDTRSRSLFLFSFLCILATLLIFFAITRDRTEIRVTDLLQLSLLASDEVEISEVLLTADEARAYIRSEFGWRVGVPVIEDIPLVGMSIVDLAPAVGVPVFIYANPNRRVVVLSLNYALLDDVPDRILLSPQDSEALSAGHPQARTRDNDEVIIWRDRDDIFIAVPDFPAGELTEAISMTGR